MMVFVMSDCIYSNMGGTAVKVDLSSLEFERILGIFCYGNEASGHRACTNGHLPTANQSEICDANRNSDGAR